MRKSKFSESQIMGILAEGEAGLTVGRGCERGGRLRMRCQAGGVEDDTFTRA